MKDDANFKIKEFREFQKVVQEGLIEAMYLHTVCLPSVEGSMIDRSKDTVWKNNLEYMSFALYDVQAKFDEVENDFYLNWPSNISEKDLAPFNKDNQALADSIIDQLKNDYPKNDFQVIVYKHTTDPDWMVRGIADGARGKGDTASVVYFDNWRGKNIHIRYKPKGAAHKNVGNFYADFKTHKTDICWKEDRGFFGIDVSYPWVCCSEAHKLYDCLIHKWSQTYQNMIDAGEGYLFVKFNQGLRSATHGNFHITNDFNQIEAVDDYTYAY